MTSQKKHPVGYNIQWTYLGGLGPQEALHSPRGADVRLGSTLLHFYLRVCFVVSWHLEHEVELDGLAELVVGRRRADVELLHGGGLGRGEG